jgi:hypothetical protein
MCVKEAGSDDWTIRLVFGDTLPEGARWAMEEGLCEQDRAALPPRVTVPLTPTPSLDQGVPPVVATPVPVIEAAFSGPPTAIADAYICVNSELLVPILDEYGEHVRDAETGYPAWLIPGDDTGTVMLGEACPIQDVAEELPERLPVVPVQIP